MLRKLGHRVTTLQQLGLPSASDDTIFKTAIRKKVVLITEDQDFTNIVRYPLTAHHGVIVMQWSRQREPAVHAALLRLLATRSTLHLKRRLIVVGQFGFRIVHPD